MTQEEIAKHWRQSARDDLEAARILREQQKFRQALFFCHLAVEKGLKAAYIEQHGEDHPFTHDLAYLAGLITHSLGMEDVEALKQLSTFVVDARYSDPFWAAEQATEKETNHWLVTAEKILSSLLSP